jgi:hypothetical protein
MTKIFTTSKMLRALFIYIVETGRWNDTLGEIPTLERESENRRGEKDKDEATQERSNTQTTLTILTGMNSLLLCTQRLRTTRWPFNADDEDRMHKGYKIQYIYCTYLVSHIWYATKENKWEQKKKKQKKIEQGREGEGLPDRTRQVNVLIAKLWGRPEMRG